MPAMADGLRQVLIDLDVAAARALWCDGASAEPVSDGDVLTTLHMARTAARSVSFRLRAYSHAWLSERGLPSQLPDALRPQAHRLYPTVASAVGISVNFRSPELKPLAAEIQRAMEGAVMDLHADGVTDPRAIRPLMQERRSAVMRKMLGRLGS